MTTGGRQGSSGALEQMPPGNYRRGRGRVRIDGVLLLVVIRKVEVTSGSRHVCLCERRNNLSNQLISHLTAHDNRRARRVCRTNLRDDKRAKSNLR